MGATNHTTNYNLSQFVGTDKPAWLQDYNGDMSKIDVGINAAKVAADSAGLAAGNAQNDADTANTAITNTINPAITALQTTVGNQGGAINTINSLIGNGTPTTTDQTIIGAINELNAGKLEADRGYVEIICDGVKSYAQILTDLEALIDYTKLTPWSKIIRINSNDGSIDIYNHQYDKASGKPVFAFMNIGSQSLTVRELELSGDYEKIVISASDTTWTDMGSDIAPSILTFRLYY